MPVKRDAGAFAHVAQIQHPVIRRGCGLVEFDVISAGSRKALGLGIVKRGPGFERRERNAARQGGAAVGEAEIPWAVEDDRIAGRLKIMPGRSFHGPIPGAKNDRLSGLQLQIDRSGRVILPDRGNSRVARKRIEQGGRLALHAQRYPAVQRAAGEVGQKVIVAGAVDAPNEPDTAVGDRLATDADGFQERRNRRPGDEAPLADAGLAVGFASFKMNAAHERFHLRLAGIQIAQPRDIAREIAGEDHRCPVIGQRMSWLIVSTGIFRCSAERRSPGNDHRAYESRFGKIGLLSWRSETKSNA